MIGGSALNQIKVFGVVLVVLLAIDIPWIFFNPSYKTLSEKINGSNSVSTMNKILYASVVYILLAVGIQYFCVNQNSYLNAVVLGLVVYGVYNFTNLSFIANYDVKTGSIDTVWGMALFLIVTAISLIISRMIISVAPTIVEDSGVVPDATGLTDGLSDSN